MPRSRPLYPSEFRAEAVQLVLAGRPVREVAGSLGWCEQPLHNWVRQHQLDQHERQDGLTSAEREELRELRRRVSKWSATFSSEPRSSSRRRPRLGASKRCRRVPASPKAAVRCVEPRY